MRNHKNQPHRLTGHLKVLTAYDSCQAKTLFLQKIQICLNLTLKPLVDMRKINQLHLLKILTL